MLLEISTQVVALEMPLSPSWVGLSIRNSYVSIQGFIIDDRIDVITVMPDPGPFKVIVLTPHFFPEIYVTEWNLVPSCGHTYTFGMVKPVNGTHPLLI